MVALINENLLTMAQVTVMMNGCRAFGHELADVLCDLAILTSVQEQPF